MVEETHFNFPCSVLLNGNPQVGTQIIQETHRTFKKTETFEDTFRN